MSVLARPRAAAFILVIAFVAVLASVPSTSSAETGGSVSGSAGLERAYNDYEHTRPPWITASRASRPTYGS